MKAWGEIRTWRKAQRVAAIARREAISDAEHRRYGERITELLVQGLPVTAGMVVGFCWPFRGEFDARFAVRYWRDRGALAALPEVVAKGAPLRFREWHPGVQMARGVYDIPFPDGTAVVLPDVVLPPMNGFDAQGYRLGYGGGYFDRTLAALDPQPLTIGVSFDALRLDTIFPQPHDVPMDFVATETGIYAATGGALAVLDTRQVRERAAALLAARRLPRCGGSSAQQGYSSPPCYAAEFPGYFGETDAQNAGCSPQPLPRTDDPKRR